MRWRGAVPSAGRAAEDHCSQVAAALTVSHVPTLQLPSVGSKVNHRVALPVLVSSATRIDEAWLTLASPRAVMRRVHVFLNPVAAGRDYQLVGEVVHRGSICYVADARVVTPDDGKTVTRASGSFIPNQSFDPTRPA